MNVSLGQVARSHEVGLSELVEVGGSNEESELEELMNWELGMIYLTSEECDECQELMSRLHKEICGFMADLGAGLKRDCLASATVYGMLSFIRRLDESIWEAYPLLCTYYLRSITLCGYAVQECDTLTLRFLDKLWERAEGSYPFPHLYKSVVWQLLDGADGSVAVGLFRALAKGQLTVKNAAMMVALNLFGDGVPSQRVK